MAKRIVALGLGGQAAEIDSATDAGALVNGGNWRISLTKWAGPLSDATVLMPEQNLNESQAEVAFKSMVRMCRAREFEVEVPIPVG